MGDVKQKTGILLSFCLLKDLLDHIHFESPSARTVESCHEENVKEKKIINQDILFQIRHLEMNVIKRL